MQGLSRNMCHSLIPSWSLLWLLLPVMLVIFSQACRGGSIPDPSPEALQEVECLCGSLAAVCDALDGVSDGEGKAQVLSFNHLVTALPPAAIHSCHLRNGALGKRLLAGPEPRRVSRAYFEAFVT